MNKLFIEPSPHIRSSITTQKVMLHVLIALLPSVIAGTVFFGLRALLLVVICVIALFVAILVISQKYGITLDAENVIMDSLQEGVESLE